MKSSKETIWGFIILLFTIAFNISIGVLVYSLVKDQEDKIIAIVILGLIIFSTLVCTIIDYYRRKKMIQEPLNEILNATDTMSHGNFNIHLETDHIYSDYNEFDLIKDNLNKMAKELATSEVLKNDFIANFSHEIKTPISIINNYAQVLNNPKLTEEEKNKYILNLQKACKRLNNLINNILKLNKLENQKLEMNFDSFNISEVLVETIVEFEELINIKNINLDCNIEEGLMINSEESYIKIIFNNLLSNAIKFSNNNGNIYISLSKKNEKYIIEFKDNGCGMDAETGKHIFDKFYQGETSHTGEGNGLGLALVKKVIDVIGGTIEVKSEKNVGTTFIVVLKEV